MKNTSQRRPVRKRGYIITSSGLLLGIVLLLIANLGFGPVLTVAMEGSTLDEHLMATAFDEGIDLNIRLEEEGAVLLRNEEGALPLDSDAQTRINLFGSRAVDFVYNANGSAAGNTMEAITLKQGLEEAGFEVNEALWLAIEEFNETGTSIDSEVKEGNTDISNFPINEAPEDIYSGQISFQALKEFSNIAVVNIGRVAGEGQDIPKSGFGEDGSGHYLELNENERTLFKNLSANDFHIIVLVNSSYAMELGFLEEYDVDAAVWIGGPGVAGTIAVGRILNGEVNPSGRLADTWVYDLSKDSTWVSANTYKYITYDAEDENYRNRGGFTEYNEGIYIGYRWYETADAEGFWNNISNDFGSGYEAVVQYPFGYGLSYSSFEQRFASEPVFDGYNASFQVEVTNTGNVSGKDVVQIYLETPYIENGIEKSKVLLSAFAKTGELAPGARQTLELSVELDDFASYHSDADGGSGAYVLDAGAYNFYLSQDSHSWADIEPGEATRFASYDLSETVVFNENISRSSDLVAADNAFSEDVFENVFAIDEGLTISLSRAGNFANAEEVFAWSVDAYDIHRTGVFGSIVVEEDSALFAALRTNNTAWGPYRGELTDASVDQHSELTFEDLHGATWDDPRWMELVSKMSVTDMQRLIGEGGWSTAEINSINKPRTTDIDGPFGLSNYIKTNVGEEQHCVSYTSEVVVASTFNVDLAYDYGEAVGNEANASGTAGWYAPGLNTHRSAFGGRNAEYYSEDPFLAGMIAASEIAGAQSKGLYVYLKHFAFNDIEANRTNLQNSWMTEQTAREIYLRAFELAIKHGEARGVMVSYMWLNGTWLGANYGLMTEVLRNEWGFEGVVITDNYAASWMNATRAIMAGTNLILSSSPRYVEADIAQTQEGILAMKESSKNILYAIGSLQDRRIVPIAPGTDWWSIIFTASISLFGAGLLAIAIVFAMRMTSTSSQ